MKFDLFYYNYNLSSEDFKYLKKELTSSSRYYYILYGLFIFCLQGIKLNLQNAFSKHKILEVNNLSSILFYHGSKNQKDSLIPIEESLKEYSVFGRLPFAQKTLDVGRAYVKSIKYILPLLKLFSDSKGYKKNSIAYFFPQYLLTYGYYRIVDEFFTITKGKIKVLILANDHVMRARVLNELAKENNIKTIFIQHASVNSFFPALNFTYACLDGQYSKAIYEKIGNSKTKIIVSGNARLEKALKTFKQIDKKIAICYNPIDHIDIVKDLTLKLHQLFPTSLIVRPHPNDKRNIEMEKFCSEKKITISDSSKIDSYSFFRNVQYLIAGESNIHLEAAAFGIKTIYYKLGQYHTKDWYSLIRNGVIINEFDDFNSLSAYLSASENQKIETNIGYYYNNFLKEHSSPLDTISKVIISCIH